MTNLASDLRQITVDHRIVQKIAAELRPYMSEDDAQYAAPRIFRIMRAILDDRAKKGVN